LISFLSIAAAIAMFWLTHHYGTTVHFSLFGHGVRINHLDELATRHFLLGSALMVLHFYFSFMRDSQEAPTVHAFPAASAGKHE
jgi:hypothetical protein